MITIHQEKETDFTKNGYGALDDYIINPEISWEMNGEFMLTFDYPVFAQYSEFLTDENIVRAPVPYMDDQLFRIYRPIPRLGYIQVTAKHIFYDLNDNFVEDTNVVGKNGLGALNQILSATQYPHRFNAFSDIDTVGNARIVRYNPVEALLDDSKDNTFINRWGGELYRDNFNIHMRKRLGSNRGVRIEHKKDLTGLESEMDFSTVTTRIMPKGFDGLLLPEKYVDSPLLDPDRPKIRVVEYSEVKAAVGEYADDEDAITLEEAYTELRRLAKEEYSIHHVDEPETVIHVDFVTLENTKEYEEFKELQEIHQGDTVRVSVPEQDFEITSRLVAFKSNPLLENHYTSTTLGNHVLEYTTSRTEIDVVRKEIKDTNELVTIARQAANGKNTNYFGPVDPNTLELDAQLRDTYFQEDGDYFAIWEFVEVNGERYWRKGPNTDFGKELNNQMVEAMEDVEEAKQTADEAVEQINAAVANAGFTSLDETISSVQSISNQAQINSGTAINNALEAMQQASQAIDNTGSLNVRVDEVENTLSAKADKQTVDDLTGVVDSQALDIQTNAQGLALKANQSTVDTLAGTVQSLGTNFDVVAGQVSSRVWNTDIETAIDGIEIGGRNFVLNSKRDISTTHANILGRNYRPLLEGETYTLSFDVKASTNTRSRRVFLNNSITINKYISITTEYQRHSVTFKYIESDYLGSQIYPNIYPSNSTGLSWTKFKIEKGNKATDWTPAPEDTDAKISHIETEWTQTFDAFSQTVAGIDGRVTSQKQTIDSISSTVSGHENRISTVEQTASGLQSTVADKASQSQVTQLANGLSSVVKDLDDLEIGGRNHVVYSDDPTGLMSNSVDTYQMNSFVRSSISLPDGTTGNVLEIGSTLANYGWLRFKPFGFDLGETYTFSIWIRRASNGSNLSVDIGINDEGRERVSVGTEWTRVKVTSDILRDVSIYNFVELRPATFIWDEGAYFYIWRPQLEKGNKATDWTPAPEDTQSQISQLANNINLRVTKGELLSQINIEAGRTLIQSDRLLLNASNTVITGTAWMDGAVIANASIDGAKIQDATIASAKIANLDVSKISGNTSEFIRTNWNNINDSIAIDGSGIAMLGNNIYRRNILNAEGISLYGDYGAYRKSGAIGYFRTDINTPDKNANVVDVGPNHEHYIGMVANKGYSLVLGFGAPGWGDRFYRRSVIVSGDTGTVTMFGSLSMRNLDGIRWVGGGSNIHEKGNHLDIRSKGRLRLFNSINSLKAEFGAGLDMYGDINMHNNDIYNQSDSRLKTNITNHEDSSLSKITQVEFKDFVWEKNNQKGFGIIAQQVRLVAPELVSEGEDGYLGINSTRLNMMTVHAVKELSLRELNTNKIASQALQLAETLADKMERLENRIEELERNVA